MTVGLEPSPCLARLASRAMPPLTGTLPALPAQPDAMLAVGMGDGRRQVNTEGDPDAALMLAFAAGQEDAFVTLYERYRDRMVNFCRRLLGDQARAEEAAQDVFLKIYDAGARYQARSRFSTYLYRVATNHCFNLNARMERKLVRGGSEAVELAADAGRDQADGVAQRQLRDALAAALAKLPDKQRAAMLLVHYEGFSYREAAATVEVSESALKALIHRARERLTRDLRQAAAELGEVRHAM